MSKKNCKRHREAETVHVPGTVVDSDIEPEHDTANVLSAVVSDSVAKPTVANIENCSPIREGNTVHELQPSDASALVVSSATIVSHPPSPASNRDRFRAALMPAQVTCDLSTVSSEPGLRFTFQGIVLVVYPASSNPVRRHVLVGDGRGTVGITEWNAHVNFFSMESIGQLLVVTKVALITHNGTRGITLNKESTVQFNCLAGHFATTWWQSIPNQVAVSAVLFNDQKDNAVVNVAGILGSVSSEQRTVRSDARDLLTLKIVDRTGIITLRSWNHSASIFQHLVDTPVLIRRVRVTSFASVKTGELFDGTATIVESGSFPGSEDLNKFWTE